MNRKPRGRYGEQQRERRGKLYLILLLILVFVVVKWGIPVFVNVIAQGGGSSSTIDSSNRDLIPPQSPVFNATPEATNSAVILVSGFTESGAGVELVGKSEQKFVTKADEKGLFRVELRLSSGDNIFSAVAIDDSGNRSKSTDISIYMDKKTLDLSIKSPSDNETITGKANVVEISGTVNKSDATVSVNNLAAMVDNKGNFTRTVQLVSGSNELVIKAVDRAGNKDERILTINYSP